MKFGTGKVQDLQCFERTKRAQGFMDFEVLWLVRIGVGRPTICQKIRSVDKESPKLWTRKNAMLANVRVALFTSAFGVGQRDMKTFTRPDCPDRTVSEKLEKILGCSKLALPEATFSNLSSKLGRQNLAWRAGRNC